MFTLTLALCLGGCFDDAEALDRVETGTIDAGDEIYEGRHCDAYPLLVGEGWSMDVRMTSEFDNYVYFSQNRELLASNDDGDQGLNAHLEHVVAAGGPSIIHACAYSQGARGEYTLAIVTRPPR